LHIKRKKADVFLRGG